MKAAGSTPPASASSPPAASAASRPGPTPAASSPPPGQAYPRPQFLRESSPERRFIPSAQAAPNRNDRTTIRLLTSADEGVRPCASPAKAREFERGRRGDVNGCGARTGEAGG